MEIINLLYIQGGCCMKVGIVFPDGFEEIEGLAVVDILRRGQADVTMIGLTDSTVSSAQKIRVIMDATVESVNFDDFDMIVMPGGAGAENYLPCEKLKNAIAAFLGNNNKFVGAICAAPNILGRWGLLNHRSVTVYPTIEVAGADIRRQKVVVDGNLITGAGPGASMEFGYALLSKMADEETVKILKEKMIV